MHLKEFVVSTTCKVFKGVRLVLLLIGNQNMARWDILSWHNIYTKLQIVVDKYKRRDRIILQACL